MDARQHSTAPEIAQGPGGRDLRAYLNEVYGQPDAAPETFSQWRERTARDLIEAAGAALEARSHAELEVALRGLAAARRTAQEAFR